MRFPKGSHQIWSFLGESIIMILTDSMSDEAHGYNPEAVNKLVRQIQQALVSRPLMRPALADDLMQGWDPALQALCSSERLV